MNVRLRMACVLAAVFANVTAADWHYEGHAGPDHWAAMSPAFAACAASNQSPIDLGAGIDAQLPPIDVSYADAHVDLIDNGHTLQANLAGDNMIVLDGREFALVQLHFHAPSEHRLDGVEFPLEMHLVHADSEGRLAVLGVLFEDGQAHPLLDTLMDRWPEHFDQSVVLEAKVNPIDLLPIARDYYRYNGSLTTPPCSEGVRWLVLKQPVTGSSAQFARLSSALRHPNNRPLQPLNARVVLQ